MMMQTQWIGEDRLFYSRIAGLFRMEQIEQWRQALLGTLAELPAKTVFIFYLNEWDYQYESKEVHTIKKAVVPEFLAACGYYPNLVGEEGRIQLMNSVRPDPKGRVCHAMAMNHHNKEMMGELNRVFGGPREAYFSDDQQARSWLQSLELP